MKDVFYILYYGNDYPGGVLINGKVQVSSGELKLSETALKSEKGNGFIQVYDEKQPYNADVVKLYPERLSVENNITNENVTISSNGIQLNVMRQTGAHEFTHMEFNLVSVIMDLQYTVKQQQALISQLINRVDELEKKGK